MSLLQNKILSGFSILCAALVLGACSPSPSTVLPTERIMITGVPATITRTEAVLATPPSLPTFKVYVQLSSGMTADAGSVAMGSVEVTPEDISADGKTCTVTIDLFKPDPNTSYLMDPDTPYQGNNWSNIAVVISPATVADIYDIDAKAASKALGGGIQQSSSSTTVTLHWKNLMPKSAMMNFSPTHVESYLRLYGEKGYPDGVIATDDGIAGTRTRADPAVITSSNMFKEVND